MLNSELFEKLERRLQELNMLISNSSVISKNTEYKKYLKEYGKILPLVDTYRRYKKVLGQLKEVEEILSKVDTDLELKKIAYEEKDKLQLEIELLSKKLSEFTSKEMEKINNIIVEIRAGAGGEEAALFASDLFRMYTKFAEKKGYTVELISSHFTGLKGFKEIVFSISGDNVYENFKYESGTHRVQRVPITEASGRIHTSTATVAVLIEPEEIELKIEPDELKIDTFRASGHGGQHLQKTESAVRITHLPSGIVVQCQDERSQLRNREKAMKVLRAKLFDLKKTEQERLVSQKRKQQIGKATRAEKIRTYNFMQNRVSDHRFGVSVFELEEILNGNLDKLLEKIKEKNEQNIPGTTNSK
ncbi:MAG: peptide chain release factor 1 [Elusimicrobiota bacterium]|nr:peptide chain release factor 1 [Elusimicrobiota bacterium]